MAETITLTASLRTFGQTMDFKSGAVPVPGFEFDFKEIKPQVAAFRRMIRDQEFDICELASTSYLIARAYGAPFKALPLFFNRHFHHHGIVVRPDAGIRTPKDLEGKKAGVRAWSVTSGVWTKGILQNEYGLDLSKVTWFVDDEEHVSQLKLPPYVQKVPEGKSLAGMMAAGEIQAGFLGNAGIGREGPPREDWGVRPVAANVAYDELIPNSEKAEAEWFAKTGVLPTHGCIVIRDEVAARHPELPRLLFDALLTAKERYVQRLREGQASTKEDRSILDLMKVVGPDPSPYGLEANIPTIATLMMYAHQQGLMPREIRPEDMFYDLNA